MTPLLYLYGSIKHNTPIYTYENNYIYNLPVPNPNPNPTPTPVSDHYIETVLQFMRNLLHEEDMKQSPHPIWESRSESPILIDKISSDSVVDGDEYIYWPN